MNPIMKRSVFSSFLSLFLVSIGLMVSPLALTGKLMFWVMLLMVPMALIVGVLAGMREGSFLDRTLSTFSIITSAECAWAITVAML